MSEDEDALHQNQDDPILDVCSGSEIIDTIDVESGDIASLVIGIYEQDFPEPNFHVDVEPLETPVSTSLVRVKDGTEYKLTYHFQNFSSDPCHITVRRCKD